MVITSFITGIREYRMSVLFFSHDCRVPPAKVKMCYIFRYEEGVVMRFLHSAVGGRLRQFRTEVRAALC